MPTAAIAVETRYGGMQLSPEMISSIAFSSEDSSVHVIDLTDGSSFNALVTAPEFEMKLTAAAQNQTVKFPVGSSVGPPGACMTPSSDVNVDAMSFLI